MDHQMEHAPVYNRVGDVGIKTFTSSRSQDVSTSEMTKSRDMQMF